LAVKPSESVTGEPARCRSKVLGRRDFHARRLHQVDERLRDVDADVHALEQPVRDHPLARGADRVDALVARDQHGVVVGVRREHGADFGHLPLAERDRLLRGSLHELGPVWSVDQHVLLVDDLHAVPARQVVVAAIAVDHARVER
jgi:hypothetical protein